MSDIPQAREKLEALLREPLPASWRAEIEDALALMRRRPYAKPVARVESRSVGPRTAALIRRYVARHPRMSVLAVARVFAVNPGRVSEALHGLR